MPVKAPRLSSQSEALTRRIISAFDLGKTAHRKRLVAMRKRFLIYSTLMQRIGVKP